MTFRTNLLLLSAQQITSKISLDTDMFASASRCISCNMPLMGPQMISSTTCKKVVTGSGLVVKVPFVQHTCAGNVCQFQPWVRKDKVVLRKNVSAHIPNRCFSIDKVNKNLLRCRFIVKLTKQYFRDQKLITTMKPRLSQRLCLTKLTAPQQYNSMYTKQP